MSSECEKLALELNTRLDAGAWTISAGERRDLWNAGQVEIRHECGWFCKTVFDLHDMPPIADHLVIQAAGHVCRQ